MSRINQIIFYFLIIFLIQIIVALNDDYYANQDGFQTRNYVNIGGHNYYISVPELQVNALLAAKICNDDGMKLVSLETEEKYNLISEYMCSNGYASLPYWTSGERFLNDWKWSGSGQIFTYTKWTTNSSHDPIQPDYDGNQCHVCVWFTCSGGWRDDPCNLLDSYPAVMCE